MAIAVRVENLSKKYTLRHARSGRARYVSLREVVAEKFSSLFRRRSDGDGTREEFWALRDVSFEIQQGEAVGIIGRNGAGKSTLLKLLSRITPPTKGRIEIDGRVASLLEVGTGFHPELTGRENIFLNGAILGMKRSEIRKKFDEIVAFAEVEKFLDTPVKHFSSGMYMRLAFAVAAHLEPEILIVDEVLAVGDAEFQNKCLGKMEDVSRGGRTVLFVSHNMDAVARMCSRCIVLGGGKIELDGGTRQAIAHYTTKRNQQETTIDLRQARREWDPRLKAIFTSIRRISADGSSGWSIPYGEPISFEMGIETRTAMSNLEAGIALATAGGTAVTANLSSETIPVKALAAGSYVFQINYRNLRLIPGFYSILLWMRSESGFEDLIQKACEFEVAVSELSSRHKTDTFNAILVPEAQASFSKAKEGAAALEGQISS